MTNEKRGPLVLPATLEECAFVMDRLASDCNSVQTQVDSAKAVQRATGRYSDPEWFARANSALRWMKRDRQRLQEHMGKLRKLEAAKAMASLDKHLIAALRERVTPEEFEACVALATLRQSAGAGGAA